MAHVSSVLFVLSGMASVDSSAPETTSSDNSPTLVRRNFTSVSGSVATTGHHGGPGSDSGSSHSDSVESSSSGCKHMAQQAQQLRGALKAQQNDVDKYVVTGLFVLVMYCYIIERHTFMQWQSTCFQANLAPSQLIPK